MADVIHPYFPPDAIVAAACAAFGVPPAKIKTKLQQPSLCCARNAAALLLREHTVLSQGEIATVLGRRHSTIGRELLNAGQRRLETDPRFAQTLEQARQRLIQGLHG